MERAKRLELDQPPSQALPPVTDDRHPPPTDTAVVTQGLELAEIIAAWTTLPIEIRTAVLTLIRMSTPDAT